MATGALEEAPEDEEDISDVRAAAGREGTGTCASWATSSAATTTAAAAMSMLAASRAFWMSAFAEGDDEREC